MTLKTTLIGLALTFALFVGCCLIMLRFHQILNAILVVYLFMAVWGISALAWPLFAVIAAWRLVGLAINRLGGQARKGS